MHREGVEAFDIRKSVRCWVGYACVQILVSMHHFKVHYPQTNILFLRRFE